MSRNDGLPSLSIVIPTWERGAVLVRTLELLLALDDRAEEILVVDQTERHPPEVDRSLHGLSAGNSIRWLRQPAPSIPRAMNRGLMEARGDIVLFLDDDIEPSPHLVAAHRGVFRNEEVAAVAGQVLQPGQLPADFGAAARNRGVIPDLYFPFNHTRPEWIANVMAGNLAVRRDKALDVGGFDENFIGVAYRFETDFALRFTAAGHRILYLPDASIHHLQIPSGGTRRWGDHLTSSSPHHSVGDYYFARFHAPAFHRYAIRRLLTSCVTRYHLRHPWAIPFKLVGELRGYGLARRLASSGRALIRRE